MTQTRKPPSEPPPLEPDEALDEALEETFPASDPIAPFEPPKPRRPEPGRRSGRLR